jgi:hypothetical protein
MSFTLGIKDGKLSQTQLKSCGLTGYTGPRKREPNEAMPISVNKMKGKFVPKRDLVAKIGLAVIS